MITQILFFLLIVSISVYAQIPNSNILIQNMKEKVYKPSDYTNVYFDLNNRSIIQTASKWDENTYEDFVGFRDSVVTGSFTKAFEKQYILILKWNYPENFGFSHVSNFGPLSQFIVFDSNYQQISKIFFQDASTEFKDILDIDNDGINEILLTGMYCNQGVCMNWINVFYKNIEEPVLNYCSEMSVFSAFTGEYDEGYTNYISNNGKFMIEVTKFSKLYLSEYDSRIIKEENCQRIYKYQKGIFTLEAGNNCELEGY